MLFDPMLLTRLQFAWVIAWHVVLPTITIGAVSFFAIADGLALVTGRAVYARVSTRPESFRSRSTWVSSREW